MGAEGTSATGGGGRVVCLGEALVDIVAEQPVAELAAARSFAPRFGGSIANIAVGAARFGADTAMVGGSGRDPWGKWLRDTLREQGVDTTRFPLVDGAPATHTFVAVSEHGEPDYAFYGSEGREQCIVASGARLDELFPPAPAGVLVFGSDTLNGHGEREVTLDARARALESGWLVLFDPNLRPVRWRDHEQMLAVVRAALEGVTVVKANLDEALQLSGADEPVAAARAIVAAGSRAVVVTMGADGLLIVVGEQEPVVVPPASAQVVDATGAGDSVAGVLAAALARAGDHAVVPVAAELATRTAARVTEAYGALDGLPPSAEARAQLERLLRT